MSDTPSTTVKKPMSLLDCLGIGINGIIGVGIFGTTATVWRQAGGYAPVAWMLVGLVCILVALCFAESATRTEQSGGPYRYAVNTFGPKIGFVVGWITLLSTVLGYSAVAYSFGETVAGDLLKIPREIVVSVTQKEINPVYLWTVRGASGALVVVLMGIHLVGVRFGTRTGSVVSFVKFLSLLIFVGVGFFFVKWGHFALGPAPDVENKEAPGLFAAAFTSLFALTGVEYVSVPAGEVQHPRRTIPLALVLSVVLVMLLYIAIQVVVVGVLPYQKAAGENAIVAATAAFAGPGGGYAMRVAFAVSVFGYGAASVLIGPRYVEALALDGFLPGFLGRRSKQGVPMAATIVLTLIALVFLSLGKRFSDLADLSNIAVVFQYIATCVAVLLQRRRGPAPAGSFVIPGGPIVPILAIGGCILLLAKVKLHEWMIAGISMVVGIVIGVGWRLWARSRGLVQPSAL